MFDAAEREALRCALEACRRNARFRTTLAVVTSEAFPRVKTAKALTYAKTLKPIDPGRLTQYQTPSLIRESQMTGRLSPLSAPQKAKKKSIRHHTPMELLRSLYLEKSYGIRDPKK